MPAIPETRAQQTAQENAIDQWNWYVTKGKPFENAFIARASQSLDGAQAQAMSSATADVGRTLSASMQSADPNRGAFLRPYTKMAAAAAKAIPQAAQATDDYRTSQVRGYTQMLRGEVPKINAGYLQEAQNAGAQAASDAQIAQQNSAINTGLVANGIGAAAGAAGALYMNRPQPQTITTPQVVTGTYTVPSNGLVIGPGGSMVFGP